MAVDTRKDTQAEAGASSKAGWILLGVAALLAAASIGYNVMGAGEADSEPLAAVAGSAGPSIEDLRAAAEASPEDAEAWAALGFALFSREDYAGAAEAYGRASAIDNEAAVLFSALGEALLYAEDAGAPDADPMPPEALAAFRRAVELDPTDPRARYFLAVKKDLDGEHEAAIADFLALLADTPPGAPWESNVVRTIRQIGQINDIETDERIAATMEQRLPQGSGGTPRMATRGPSAADVAAAQDMSEGDRAAMIAGMVSQLEERLEGEPGNLDGWVMLMRSRMMLGEAAQAKAALQRAIAANPEEATELRRQAAMLGIE
jgi:cytochrome c-type biogenesis protein CcmH